MKLASSLVVAIASATSLLNFANRALKSALFSQIAGSAAVPPPVLLSSGNSSGVFSRPVSECFQGSLRDGEIERSTALRHIEQLLGRDAVIMHQGAALGDHIGSQHAADPTCQYNGHSRQAFHVILPHHSTQRTHRNSKIISSHAKKPSQVCDFDRRASPLPPIPSRGHLLRSHLVADTNIRSALLIAVP